MSGRNGRLAEDRSTTAIFQILLLPLPPLSSVHASIIQLAPRVHLCRSVTKWLWVTLGPA